MKEQVVRELRRFVEEGELRAGEQLPSERELSEQLRVSRGTVREAVQFLHALGLVEIRHGSGTFVRGTAVDADDMRDEWRRWTVRHSGRIHDLLEVRKGLESFAAELAAGRIADDGLETMADALAEMDAAIATGDVAALVQADVLFHHAMCVASGNAALVELADALGDKLLRERAATWDLPGRPQRSLEQHREIYEAVQARDAPRAHVAVFTHLGSVGTDVDRLLTEREEPPAGDRDAPMPKSSQSEAGRRNPHEQGER